jgi:transketolase
MEAVTPPVLIDPREALIDELIAVAAEEPRLVVLDADVSRTSRTRRFRSAYPGRFYDVGVAEQNLFGVAAGLAATGRIPVAVTFAIFASLRAAEPIRTSICYPRMNVKIIGGYAGLSNGKDGATHQSLEDIAILRSFANLVVLSPSDGLLARKMLRAAVAHPGPVYIRLEYEDVPVLHDEACEFRIGRGTVLRPGREVTVASYGIAAGRALAVAVECAGEGIDVEVLDMACLKPFDAELLLESVRRTGALVTVEDHNLIGGLASIVCECLVRARVQVPVQFLGIQDVYTESGKSDEVRDKYGVGRAAIRQAIREVRARSARTGPAAAADEELGQ